MNLRKTYSETLAGLFTIIDCLLLIPILFVGIFYIIPLFIYIGIFSFASFFSKDYVFGIVFFTICSAVFAIFAFGVRLMSGYFKLSRGKMAKNKIDKLWISTIFFNALFFFPSLYINLQCWLSEKCLLDSFSNSNNELKILSEFSPVFILLTIWWTIATIIPFTALLSTDINDTV